jgi:hypothetical protein
LLPQQYDWIGGAAACAKVHGNAAPLALETEEEYNLLKPWLTNVLSSEKTIEENVQPE